MWRLLNRERTWTNWILHPECAWKETVVPKHFVLCWKKGNYSFSESNYHPSKTPTCENANLFERRETELRMQKMEFSDTQKHSRKVFFNPRSTIRYWYACNPREAHSNTVVLYWFTDMKDAGAGVMELGSMVCMTVEARKYMQVISKRH